MERVRRQWVAQVQVEYASAARTAELLHWLIQLGVSPDTLETCRRVVADELVHAELSRDTVVAAGGDAAAIPIDPATLVLTHEQGGSLPARALGAVAAIFCCGESLAVPLFLEMRREATEPAAVTALDRIVKDEAVHRAFGWNALDELLERFGDDGRALLASRLPAYIEEARTTYTGRAFERSDVHRAFGLIDIERYEALTETCIQDVLLPRFRALGVLADR